MRIIAKNPIFSMACCILLAITASPLRAQERAIEAPSGPSDAPAAIVNDSVITTYDVRQRMRLMALSSGGQLPPEALPQLQRQALKDLINEKLQILETTKFEMKVDDKEIDAEVMQIAAQGGLTVAELEQVLSSQGVSMAALRRQVEASIAWPRLVQGRYRDRIRVSDKEVESMLQRMTDDASKEQFLVSEICIAVDDPAQAQTYYEGSLQLIDQMRKGVPFAVVAQQFSACTSAAGGGDVGWVQAGELPKEQDDAIKSLPIGAVSNPIPSEGAFIILALRDKREETIAGEPTFTMVYAGAAKSVGRNTALLSFQKLETAGACGGQGLRQDLGENIGITLQESMKLSDVAPAFREAVEDLQRGDTSGMIETDDAFHAVYVCDKDEGLGLPSREALKDRIFSRQLSMIARRYLRDIERDSTVDIRMKSQTQQQPNG